MFRPRHSWGLFGAHEDAIMPRIGGFAMSSLSTHAPEVLK